MSQLSVSYDRKFSDGNYGSEGCSMSMTWDSDGNSSEQTEQFEAAAAALRRLVLTELAGSSSHLVSFSASAELETKPVPVDSAGHPPDLEDIPF